MVRLSCEIESQIIAVERIKEYCEIDREASYETDRVLTSKEWPERGTIQFIKYATQYREGMDLVLNNLTFSVSSGQKIGIVGRTGAGITF